MDFIVLTKDENVATVRIQRGKVNALNDQVVAELRSCFQDLSVDPAVKSVILTGNGKFFSFGFDIPEFLSYSKEEFTRYLLSFADLYTYLFLFPKPVTAALNGHTIAGGCMLATACDHRLMVTGKARISLNEVSFGSSVFAGSVAMLKACAGERNAERILYSGGMYSAEEAMELGLIHRAVAEEHLPEVAASVAREFAQRDARAFQSIKLLLRKNIAVEMRRKEKDSVIEFVEIWYSQATMGQLRNITIRG
jgi:Delta3-Delta2-enoyl-CoA isomerase